MEIKEAARLESWEPHADCAGLLLNLFEASGPHQGSQRVLLTELKGRGGFLVNLGGWRSTSFECVVEGREVDVAFLRAPDNVGGPALTS